jgi:hypothetical protein
MLAAATRSNHMDMDIKDYQTIAVRIKDLEIKIKHLRQDYDARVLTITPETGWPGKNADERDTSKARAEASDKACADMREMIRAYEHDLAEAEGEMDAFEIARREREWQVRERIAEALQVRGVPSEALPF